MSHCWLLRLDIAQSGAPNKQVRPSFRVDMLRDAERVPGAFQQTMPQGPVKKWDVQVNAAKGGTLTERVMTTYCKPISSRRIKRPVSMCTSRSYWGGAEA
jgi:hypothetical protein